MSGEQKRPPVQQAKGKSDATYALLLLACTLYPACSSTQAERSPLTGASHPTRRADRRKVIGPSPFCLLLARLVRAFFWGVVMPKILEMLSAAMPECREPIAWAKAFQRGMERFPVQDVAMLFAQVGHESQGLTRLEEGLSYSSVDRILKIFPSSTRGLGPAELQKLVRNPERLANVVYAGKNGNGNSLSGDGWKFRGRGPIQTSCLNNYLALGRAIVEAAQHFPDADDIALSEDVAIWEDDCHGGGPRTVLVMDDYQHALLADISEAVATYREGMAGDAPQRDDRAERVGRAVLLSFGYAPFTYYKWADALERHTLVTPARLLRAIADAMEEP